MSKQRQPDNQMSEQDLDQEVAQDVPDREAMTTLGLPNIDLPGIGLPVEPIPLPIQEINNLETTLTSQLPPEAAGIDLEAVAAGALSDDGSPLDALPPELVPDTTQVTETSTIGGTQSTSGM